MLIPLEDTHPWFLGRPSFSDKQSISSPLRQLFPFLIFTEKKTFPDLRDCFGGYLIAPMCVLLCYQIPSLSLILGTRILVFVSLLTTAKHNSIFAVRLLSSESHLPTAGSPASFLVLKP